MLHVDASAFAMEGAIVFSKTSEFASEAILCSSTLKCSRKLRKARTYYHLSGWEAYKIGKKK